MIPPCENAKGKERRTACVLPFKIGSCTCTNVTNLIYEVCESLTKKYSSKSLFFSFVFSHGGIVNE